MYFLTKLRTRFLIFFSPENHAHGCHETWFRGGWRDCMRQMIGVFGVEDCWFFGKILFLVDLYEVRWNDCIHKQFNFCRSATLRSIAGTSASAFVIRKTASTNQMPAVAKSRVRENVLLESMCVRLSAERIPALLAVSRSRVSLSLAVTSTSLNATMIRRRYVALEDPNYPNHF